MIKHIFFGSCLIYSGIFLLSKSSSAGDAGYSLFQNYVVVNTTDLSFDSDDIIVHYEDNSEVPWGNTIDSYDAIAPLRDVYPNTGIGKRILGYSILGQNLSDTTLFITLKNGKKVKLKAESFDGDECKLLICDDSPYTTKKLIIYNFTESDFHLYSVSYEGEAPTYRTSGPEPIEALKISLFNIETLNLGDFRYGRKITDVNILNFDPSILIYKDFNADDCFKGQYALGVEITNSPSR